MTPIVQSCRRGEHVSKILPSLGPPYHTSYSDTDQGLGHKPSNNDLRSQWTKKKQSKHSPSSYTERSSPQEKQRRTRPASAADLQSSSRIVERKERKVEAEASSNLQVVVDRRHRRDQIVEMDSSLPAAGSWSSRKIDWIRRAVVVLTLTSMAKKSTGLTYSCASTTQYRPNTFIVR